MATGDERDELSGGGAEPPRRWSWRQQRTRGVLAPVGVLAVLALVLVGLGSGHRGGDTPAPTTSTPAPSGDARPDLAVDELCTVLTEGDRDLLLTFRLVNRGAQRVVVDGVEPSLPLGGLVPVDVGYTTGDCLRSTPAAPGVALDPAQGVRVTFLLRLPGGCAAAYPVAASVDSHTTTSGPASSSLLVLPDLGSLRLPHCDSPTSSP